MNDGGWELAEEIWRLGLSFSEDRLEVGLGMGGLHFGELLLLEAHLVEEAGLRVVAVGDLGEDGIDGQSFEGLDGTFAVPKKRTQPEGLRAGIAGDDASGVDGIGQGSLGFFGAGGSALLVERFDLFVLAFDQIAEAVDFTFDGGHGVIGWIDYWARGRSWFCLRRTSSRKRSRVWPVVNSWNSMRSRSES